MTMKEATSNYLNSLGESPEQVKNSLLADGYRGHRAESGSCPLARALIDNLPKLLSLGVDCTDVSYRNKDDFDFVEMPRPCREFVEAFDNQMFPELELKNEE